ncbi:MAG: hypothetical protein JXQ29_05535, partial [Planctomycetes bacterium]|nr:hypothetical protein [Planctomycetota bacterium]
MESFFLNGSRIRRAVLAAAGGFFGPVLRLAAFKRVPLVKFRALLVAVIRALEAMPPGERLRWLEFLSYIHALVYHVRLPEEQPGLWRQIEASAATERHRQEVGKVTKTIADVLKEQAGIETTRKNLVRLLRLRFGDLPAETIALIESTKSLR